MFVARASIFERSNARILLIHINIYVDTCSPAKIELEITRLYPELLRKTAEHTLVEMVRLLFVRWVVTDKKPFKLPLIFLMSNVQSGLFFNSKYEIDICAFSYV